MIKLHHVPWSRSFRVLWLLEELGLRSTIECYSITDGSLRHPDFLAISPAGRVPALEIDGQVLFESGAIVEYLCETRPEAGLGRAPGHPERPRYLEFLHFAETQAALIANLNLAQVFLRDPAARSPLLIKLDTKRLEKTLAPLERRLGAQDWLLASGFSGADVMLGFNLFAVPFFVHLDDFPNLRAYIDRVKARPGWQAAAQIEGPQNFYAQDFYEVPDV
ncbi:glutathione S-transferase family protein [Aliiroseovarius sp. S1339]|uniref:glutathione S-transferase family protein n=1 Tax=Aliiroseovarius sp. S1339 TaxID=2936990 RepID=UPI0020BE244D|nr:glutathione S-transferase family protein [Aliiroseovarius sp. S1339]MCK8465470.1 glutathione S-transferase family protein [Aliiroseovarius sp. S1339]